MARREAGASARERRRAKEGRRGPALSDVAEELTSSYERDGGVNPLSGEALPSREGVVEILRRFEDLCFPGFITSERLESGELLRVTEEKLARLYHLVHEQVWKSFLYECRVADTPCKEAEVEEKATAVAAGFIAEVPRLRRLLLFDVDALVEGDPAARSKEEVILAYPGLQAILVHRVAHHFWNAGPRLIARMMSEHIHSRTGIDIHPGARIGKSFHIDHGTGVVIGETTVIGDHVKIYQGVSLGALSVKRKYAEQKRHPTIEDHVTIYAGATILGGQTVVGHHSVVGGNVWLVKSVPPYSVVENAPRIRVVPRGGKGEWSYEA